MSTPTGGTTITYQRSSRKWDLPQCAVGAVLLALAWPAAASAPHVQAGAQAQIPSIMAEIKVGGLANEEDAFNRLISLRDTNRPAPPQVSTAIHRGLIEILHWENHNSVLESQAFWEATAKADASRSRQVSPTAAPGEGAFLGNCIEAVASLHDPNAIPELLDDIETGGMATQAIASFGDRVVPALRHRLTAKSSGSTVCVNANPQSCLKMLHASTLRALTQMASPPTFKGLRRQNQSFLRSLIAEKIKTGSDLEESIALNGARLLRDPDLIPLIVQSSHAQNAGVRFAAVMALGKMGDPALRPVLKKIEATDKDESVRALAREFLVRPGHGQ